MAAEVGGHVEPGFEGVRDAFANNFAEHGEVGATYAFYVEGTRVVDLWGGERPDRGVPYDGDTLQIVFSSTKGAAAACAHLLAQRGQLDLDAPVVTYWPEFGQAGKDHIPVRWLLSHQAGLPTIDAELSREEALAWEPVIHALEVQKPYWEPGTAHGYHALTYGYLVGEVVRRIDGRTLGSFFHEELAEPLGLDFWIGLPEEYEPRVAPMIPMGAGDGASLEDLLGCGFADGAGAQPQRRARRRSGVQCEPARLPRRRAPGGERRRQRPFAGAPVRGADRRCRRRTARGDARRRADRRRPRPADVRPGPGALAPRFRRRVDDRARILGGVTVRTDGRAARVRALRRRRVGRLRRSRAPRRRWLRDEQDGHGRLGRPTFGCAHPGQLRGSRRDIAHG